MVFATMAVCDVYSVCLLFVGVLLVAGAADFLYKAYELAERLARSSRWYCGRWNTAAFRRTDGPSRTAGMRTHFGADK